VNFCTVSNHDHSQVHESPGSRQNSLCRCNCHSRGRCQCQGSSRQPGCLRKSVSQPELDCLRHQSESWHTTSSERHKAEFFKKEGTRDPERHASRLSTQGKSLDQHQNPCEQYPTPFRLWLLHRVCTGYAPPSFPIMLKGAPGICRPSPTHAHLSPISQPCQSNQAPY
jgi:hypothetical protein